MINKLDAEFRFQQNALALRADRQQVLASNIANADTPGYQARDIDFRSALAGALAAAPAAAPAAAEVSATHPQHLPIPSTNAAAGELLYRIPRQDSIDGNTVELDAERAQFADNAVRYEAGLTDLNAKIKGLLAVIQGN